MIDEKGSDFLLTYVLPKSPSPFAWIMTHYDFSLFQVLMTKLSSIFATGMVTVQRTNYELCMEFLEGLSGVCGEDKRLHLRRRLLAQETVVEFKARWNLPIYFQLR